MRLKIAESVNRKAWDASICSIGGSVFHSSVWAKYITKDHPQVVPQFMTLLSDQNEICGAALGFYQSSPRKLLRPFRGQLWLDALPVLSVKGDTGSILDEFLRQLEAYARASGVVELKCGSFASPTGAQELQESGFKLTKRLEFAFELERSEDEILKGMEYSRRNKIKKAMKMNLTIRDLPGEDGVKTLRRLQADSATRATTRGGPDFRYQGDVGNDPATILVDSGVGRIVGADLNGKVVSAALFTCFNGLVYYTLSGHSGEALQTQAPTLLLWETIKRYQKEGCRIFNLGGCKLEAMSETSTEHGVYAYKKAFGATLWECASGEKILFTAAKRITDIVKSGLIARLYRRVAAI